ncbi:hypothetical protein SAMN05216390_11536 [Lachnospiraceae bacterium KH1T2]|nr:hypothetical protein SAMN05216390_11536 [Lachnospiraceae bacterium KH1T2]
MSEKKLNILSAILLAAAVLVLYKFVFMIDAPGGNKPIWMIKSVMLSTKESDTQRQFWYLLPKSNLWADTEVGYTKYVDDPITPKFYYGFEAENYKITCYNNDTLPEYANIKYHIVDDLYADCSLFELDEFKENPFDHIYKQGEVDYEDCDEQYFYEKSDRTPDEIYESMSDIKNEIYNTVNELSEYEYNQIRINSILAIVGTVMIFGIIAGIRKRGSF